MSMFKCDVYVQILCLRQRQAELRSAGATGEGYPGPVGKALVDRQRGVRP